MNYNEYEEVINGEKTYKKIAKELNNDKCVLIGYSDEKFTHYDILFKYAVEKYGQVQRGLKVFYLYMSIIGLGAFAFRTDKKIYESYIQQNFNTTLDLSKYEL